MANLKNTVISDTVFKLPVGDTAARPTGTNGAQLRFNTETGQLEQFRPGVGAWIAPSNTGVIATGGDSVYDVDAEGTTYRVHVFTATGTSTFSVTQGGEVEYLIVAGGGGGGRNAGAGGGAGGLLPGNTTVTPQAYTFTVGTGGNGGTGSSGTAGNGQNSIAFGSTAIGGGGGTNGGSGQGATGGSGGGGAAGSGTGTAPGGTGTAGQGNDGGAGLFDGGVPRTGGGGGGAGAPGQDTPSDQQGGNGGIGINTFITGASIFYAGGGGGASHEGATFGVGGFGGGGNAGLSASVYDNGDPIFPGDPGTPGTGGGGGAGSGGGENGGDGGSGIVVIRYPLRQNNPETAAGQDVGNGLVLDLDFAKPTVYSGSGSVVSDSRLNGIEGDINGASFVNPRTHRSAFEFDGSNDYIQSSMNITDYTNLTISVWVNFNSFEYVWDQSPGATGGALRFEGTQPECFFYKNGNTNVLTHSQSLQNNRWYLITATNDNNEVSLSVDTSRESISFSGTFSTNTADFVIGSTYDLGSAYFTDMKISQFKIWNRVLNNEEVTQLFNATRWRFGV